MKKLPNMEMKNQDRLQQITHRLTFTNNVFSYNLTLFFFFIPLQHKLRCKTFYLIINSVLYPKDHLKGETLNNETQALEELSTSLCFCPLLDNKRAFSHYPDKMGSLYALILWW